MATLTLTAIKPERISFWIKGTSPMIQHAWSEKAKAQLRMTAAERKKQPKVARDPEQDAANATYTTADGEPGVPLLAFKAAIITAAHKDYGIEKTTVRKALFVPCSDPNNVIPMEYESMRVREDIVRVGMAQTDLRYRPEFTGWRVKVSAQIDSSLLTVQNVIDLTNRAGFSVGIGEWRPEKGGEFGRFEVDTSQPIEQEG